MSTSKRDIWAGRILTGIVTFALLGSGIAKIAGVPKMVDGLTHAGIPAASILAIAALELSCLILYLIPRTTVLGTLLLTGYFGGATVTHLIGGESLVPPLVVGLVVWGGAYFRVPELHGLLPFRNAREKLDARAGVRNEQPLPTRG
ncbi:MAG TPA: DoxX family protein [Bryobacteraceae bacterium]|nr:DoxX family protein [Bryobacteraceae bacterium]